MAERVIAGKYKLIAPIGRGGMAAVYRAQQTSDGKLVALKLLNLEEGAAAPDRDDVPDDTRELIERFEREARAASSMDTEHIVQVYDAGVDEVTGVPYIAMELLEGRDLNQLLHKLGVLAPEVAVRLVGQALTGLAQAHGAGIVHRDLKPANLFVDDSAFGQVKVKIVDFGIAKVQKAPIATLATVETAGLTQTGSVLGTPRYMSPEQIERPRSVNARSDVWSMGVVLYKCLTGRCPHDDAETLGAMLMALMTKPSPPIRSIAPWISPELSLVVHRALERDPSLRYASASAMLDALRPLAPKGFGLRDRELVALDDERKAQLRSLAPAMPSMTNEGAATIDQHGGLPALAKAGASGASAPVASESAPVPPVPPVPPTRAATIAEREPREEDGRAPRLVPRGGAAALPRTGKAERPSTEPAEGRGPAAPCAPRHHGAPDLRRAGGGRLGGPARDGAPRAEERGPLRRTRSPRRGPPRCSRRSPEMPFLVPRAARRACASTTSSSPGSRRSAMRPSSRTPSRAARGSAVCMYGTCSRAPARPTPRA